MTIWKRLPPKALASFPQADEILSGISDIDFAQLNSAIENLDGAVQAFSDLDVETLNEAIANLNSTIQPLASFLNRFR